MELIYRCQQCYKTFPCLNELETHVRTHPSQDYHEIEHASEKPFSCTKCEKTFITKDDWKKHERTHTVKTGNNDLVSTDLLLAHSTEQVDPKRHESENPFRCKQCDKNLSDINALKGHECESLRGKGEEMPKCQHCSKNGNVQSEPAKKPFSCASCDKKFTSCLKIGSLNMQCAQTEEAPNT